MSERIAIGPRTKVGALLDAYPELEDVLIGLAPAFAKLKNPMLRKTVARVATLEAAARVGGIEIGALVLALRRAAGSTDADGSAGEREAAECGETSADEPSRDLVLRAWPCALSIDVDLALDQGEHPLARVETALRSLEPERTIALVASFRPEPLIDRLRGRGFRVDVEVDASRTTRVLVARP